MMLVRALASTIVVLLLASAAPPDTAKAPPRSTPAGWGPAPGGSPHGASPHQASPHAASPHGAKPAAKPAAAKKNAKPAGDEGKLVPPVSDTASAATPTTDGKPLRVSRIAIGIRHRVAHDFSERQDVKLKEEFKIGDGEYTARIIEFVPDFMIENRKVVSRSREPRNPAVRVAVKQNGAPQDTSWAFLNFPPHFSAKSVLAFQMIRIEFENHVPVEARRDTAAARRGHP